MGLLAKTTSPSNVTAHREVKAHQTIPVHHAARKATWPDPIFYGVIGLIVCAAAAVIFRRCRPVIPTTLLAALALIAPVIPWFPVVFIGTAILCAWIFWGDHERDKAKKREATRNAAHLVTRVGDEIERRLGPIQKPAGRENQTAFAFGTARLLDRLFGLLSNAHVKVMMRRMDELGAPKAGKYSGKTMIRSNEILDAVSRDAMDTFNKEYRPAVLDLTSQFASLGFDTSDIDVRLVNGRPSGLDELEDIVAELYALAAKAFGT